MPIAAFLSLCPRARPIARRHSLRSVGAVFGCNPSHKIIRIGEDLSYMLATKMRGEMLDGGRGEELEALIGAARGMQDELLNGVSGSESRGMGSTRRRWSEAQKRHMVGES